MRVNGIQPILHSAAESDVSSSSSLALSAEEMSERGSEHNLQSFLKSIDLGRRAGGKPFTQAKVSRRMTMGNMNRCLRDLPTHTLMCNNLHTAQQQLLKHLCCATLTPVKLHIDFRSWVQCSNCACAVILL